VAVASAGPHASLHLAPESRQITMPSTTTLFFTGRMPFLLPDQQHQSTEGQSCTTNPQQIGVTELGRRSTLVYHTDHAPLFTARCGRAGPSATAGTGSTSHTLLSVTDRRRGVESRPERSRSRWSLGTGTVRSRSVEHRAPSD